MKGTHTRAHALPGISAVLLVVFLSTGGAHAQQPGFADTPVTSALELDALRGQYGNSQITVQSNQDLEASVTGSTFNVGTLNSGAVTIGEHALDNFSGVGLFNIVTGNNNAVNAAIGVTFNLQ